MQLAKACGLGILPHVHGGMEDPSASQPAVGVACMRSELACGPGSLVSLQIPVRTQPSWALNVADAMDRTAGTVFFAQPGVDTWRIQSLGRWGSDAIKNYLRGAHITGLSTISQEASLGRSLETSRAELVSLQEQARALRNKLASAIHDEAIIPSTSSGTLLALTSSDLLDGATMPSTEEQDSNRFGSCPVSEQENG